jgi:hypothetical protein
MKATTYCTDYTVRANDFSKISKWRYATGRVSTRPARDFQRIPANSRIGPWEELEGWKAKDPFHALTKSNKTKNYRRVELRITMIGTRL